MTPASVLRGPTVRALIKSYLLVGLALIVVAITFISIRITREVDAQAVLTTRLLATLTADRVFSVSANPRPLAELVEAIDAVAVPVIFTDASGMPWLWNERRVGIPLPEDLAEFRSQDLTAPTDPALRALLDRVAHYDGQRPALPVRDPASGEVRAYMHYGESALSRRLAFLPWLEAGLIVAFMGVALVAFRNLKRSEERSIWVGMAKETAHQMGTPLTSMSGWLALLGEDLQSAEAGEGRRSTNAIDREQTLLELERDHQRLAKVSARFSQIGSRPKLVSGRVDELVENACAYFRRRLPHLGSHVELVTRIEEVPAAPINSELLEWALENLIKNALDAIDKEAGRVEVSCRFDADDEVVEIEIRDNGKGMTPAVQRRVFQPGFSTRQGGWGLGLVLVRRIVRDYHGGRVEVASSVPGQGTTMRLRLNAR